MRLFRIGQTEIRLHPGLLLVLAGAAVFGMMSELLQSFAALTLHEAFHGIVAAQMGYRVEALELLPFGGVAKMTKAPLSVRADFLIAMAGPLCNLIVAGAIVLIAQHLPSVTVPLHYFVQANLLLAVFNLLPALPLDGGRMLKAVLTKALRARTAVLITAWIGIVLSGAMLVLAALIAAKGAVNPFLFIMGVFLLSAAARELRAMPQARLNAMLRRKDSFDKGEAVEMRALAVRADMPASKALTEMSDVRYTVLHVLNEELRIIGRLDEGALLDGIARKGAQVRVGELV